MCSRSHFGSSRCSRSHFDSILQLARLRSLARMPMFWGEMESVLWQVQAGEAWHDLHWYDGYLLERAWDEREESVKLPFWADYMFYLPRAGGSLWLNGYGPQQLNVKTGEWSDMRRVLILAA